MNSALVIGLGSIGRRHLRNLATLFPNATLSVLRHNEAADPEAEALGATIITNPQIALKNHYDLVVLATPSANHIDLLPDLIGKGFNLLIEKPIVSETSDCNLILELLKTAPKAIRTAGFNFRYLPSLRRMKQLSVEGDFGNVVRASLTAGLWLPDWRPEQDYTVGYSSDARRGCGVELDLVHEIDVARWLFGDLSLEYVCGLHASKLKINANDTSAMVFRGTTGSPLVQISLDYVSRQRVRYYEITGDEASAQWDLNGHLKRLDSVGVELLTDEPIDFDVGQTYLAMLSNVADTIQGKTATLPQTLEDGIASTLLALQARDQGSTR